MSCPYAPDAVRVHLDDGEIVLVEPGTPTLTLASPPRRPFGPTLLSYFTLRTSAGIRCPLGHLHATEAIADVDGYAVVTP